MSIKNPTAADRHIGQRLRLRRTNLGMSQEALGTKVSLTFQQIQKYEKGTNRISAARLFELANILDVDVGFFFEGLEARHSETQGMQESVSLPAFLDFVSSKEGSALNQSFTKIRDKRTRQSIINLTRTLEKAQPKIAKPKKRAK
ncbi:MAG: helix-turn-helix domain-containing protein [Alphaproteobacteria bacterium]|nr:helix-turn-helix domain-containing protein [Alphaproteobacteria bacterium]MDD9841401.1 helix-turn-helix domain-containing protein [Alphaproteobacteria bacterium]